MADDVCSDDEVKVFNDWTGKLIAALKSFHEQKRPQVLYVLPSTAEALTSPDNLSTTATVFRNGGNSSGEDAVPFVRLTPETIAILRLSSDYRMNEMTSAD